MSHCGDKWDDVDHSQREELFAKYQVYPTEYISNNGDSVGKGALIYRVNGQYYKESEAWKVILGISMCSTEVDARTEKVISGSRSPEERRTVSPNVEKLVSSLRPSYYSLKTFGLLEGENDLVYEYHVTDTVIDQVRVKIYLYKNTDRVVISDIDGTITK